MIHSGGDVSHSTLALLQWPLLINLRPKGHPNSQISLLKSGWNKNICQFFLTYGLNAELHFKMHSGSQGSPNNTTKQLDTNTSTSQSFYLSEALLPGGAGMLVHVCSWKHPLLLYWRWVFINAQLHIREELTSQKRRTPTNYDEQKSAFLSLFYLKLHLSFAINLPLVLAFFCHLWC